MKNNVFYSYKKKCRIKQIDKRQARKIFNDGGEIFFQSSNMAFEGLWQNAMPLKKDELWRSDFDQVCSDFMYYNCDSERGRYIKFYTRVKEA